MSAAIDNVIEFPGADEAAATEMAAIQPGRYTAVYVRHDGVFVFRQPKLRVMFRLFEHPDITLPRWYRVTGYKTRISAPRQSDLVRELQAALGRKVRDDRIPVASFKDIPVIVQVRTVIVDREQHSLADVNQYQVISRVEGKA